MERAAWTDERLDDLAEAMRSGFVRVDQGFARVGQDIRDLRTETNAGFQQLRGEIGGLRGEIGGLRGEINGLRAVMFRFGGGIIVALIGVIAAILARGV
jgi:hypothetical protein